MTTAHITGNVGGSQGRVRIGFWPVEHDIEVTVGGQGYGVEISELPVPAEK